MRSRYVYVLLFGVPGALVALLSSLALAGAVAGGLWLYAYGDAPWPPAAGYVLLAASAASFLAVWGVSLALGYRVGRRAEDGRGVPRRHVVMSIAGTLVPVVLLLAHQWRVGNLGPPGPGAACAERCRAAGYPGSGTTLGPPGPPTCICLDGAGRQALQVPLDGGPPG